MYYIGPFFLVVWFFIKCGFVVLVFLPIYVICCPYFLCDDPAFEDHYNYLGGFDDFL